MNKESEFKHLFNNKIWPEMLMKFGSAVYGRKQIEYGIEYHRWFKYKKEYLTIKSWLK